jgi:hypothetical protein
MLPDSLKRYLSDVEQSIAQLGGVYVERYEEEILSQNRINLRLRIRFKSGAMLEINEAVIFLTDSISHLGYRYHFQNSGNELIFRYDNTPHFQNIISFPHHLHTPKEVIASEKPSLPKVLKEAEKWEKQAS